MKIIRKLRLHISRMKRYNNYIKEMKSPEYIMSRDQEGYVLKPRLFPIEIKDAFIDNYWIGNEKENYHFHGRLTFLLNDNKHEISFRLSNPEFNKDDMLYVSPFNYGMTYLSF